MGIAHFLHGLGHDGQVVRPLDRAQAEALMDGALDGTLNDLELGAFTLAMQVRSETVDELDGFLRAVTKHCLPMDLPGPLVVLPSYGQPQRLPNLTTLLALLLAQEGVSVLVHGSGVESPHTSTARLFRHLGLPVASDALEVSHGWSRHEPVFVDPQIWCRPLARLMALRDALGLTQAGLAVAQWLAPEGPSVLRVIHAGDAAQAHLASAMVARHAMHALVLRGAEGEPVADARRQPAMDVFLHGRERPGLSIEPQEGRPSTLPVLPRETDVASTAHYIQSVVSGEKPAPAPLLRQVDALLSALAALRASAADNGLTWSASMR